MQNVSVFGCLKNDHQTSEIVVCFQKRDESFFALFSDEKIAEFIDFEFIFDSNFKHFLNIFLLFF